MCEDSNSSNSIVLKNVPTSFGLIQSKDLIKRKLNDDNAVASIEYGQTNDGQILQSNVIVQLKTSLHVDDLLKEPFIEVEHEFKLHKILVTKPRSKSSGRVPLPKNQPGPSVRNDADTMENVFVETSSVYCTRIPSDMYNGTELRYHFGKFGHVERVFFPPKKRTYAIIFFSDHFAASEAIRSGGRINGRRERISIKPNREERDSRRNSDKIGLYSTGGPPPRTNRQPKSSAAKEMGDQSRYSSSFDEPRGAVTLQTHQLNWNQILNKERHLFTEPFERCVLVQNLPGYARASGDDLRSYFESLDHCGGRVVSMRRIIDGILVEFYDDETAESVLVNDHHIGSLPLKIHPKTIPSIHENCFVVEGNFDNMDTIKAWLECGYSRDEFTLECHSENAIYLLKFSKPVDYQELMTFTKKVPLDKIKPKIRELTHSDCIIVKGLPADFTNDDMIRLTFMNRSKTGGGPVTMVKRKPKDTRAFVYFSNWRDAANVVGKSKRIEIGGNEVQVCLWYNHVTRVADKKKSARNASKSQSKNSGSDRNRSPLHSFEFQIQYDADVIEYVKSKSNHFERLSNDLEPLALIDFPDSKTPTKIRFKPNFKKLNPGLNQVTFEEDCKKFVESFFAKFVTQTVTLDSKNLSQLRVSHVWKETAGLVQVEVDENSEALQVFVRWDILSPGSAKVTGLPNEVPEVIKWLKKKCNISKEAIPFGPEKFKILIDFKLVDDLERKFRSSDVIIKLHKTSESLLIEGPSAAVKQVRQEVATSLQNVSSSQLPQLHREQVDYLRDIFAQPTTANVKVIDAIQQHFKRNNIRAFFRVQPSFALVCCRNSDLQDATQYLDSYVSRKEIEVRRDFNQITQSQDWKRLEQDIEEQQGGRVRFLKDKRNSKLILIGVRASVQTAYRRITEHIKDNIVETRTVMLDGIFASFLQAFPNQIKANDFLAAVDWEINLGKRSEIVLKGKNLDVAKAEAWLDDQKGSIERKSLQVKEPGMSHYFRSSKGKEFLQTTQTICKCIILINSFNATSPISQTASQSGTPKQKRTLISGKLPGKSVSIFVVQNDITEQVCDAIVNASNEELELRSAGVSGAILSKGGASIQQAMDVAKKRLGGKLPVGSAETTHAGNLPACKKIIHVVGPEWSKTTPRKASNQLGQCVFSCLTECDRYGITSVAIPAISSGVFGGKPLECAQIITNYIVKYFNNQDSVINKIILIENSKKDVLNAFSNEVAKITGSKPSVDAKPSSPPKPALRSLPGTSSSSPPLQLKISVFQGDISSMRADVIVTSCTPKTFHSCSGSATSKALLSAAGPGLKAECQQKAETDLQVGDVLQTAGHGLDCSEVFHILLEEYNGSNDDVLVTAVQTCLLLADQRGYSSVAFPAIGTGGMKYPQDILVNCWTYQAKYFKGSNLKSVYLVLHPSDLNTIAELEQQFGSSSPVRQRATSSRYISVEKIDDVFLHEYDQYDVSLETQHQGIYSPQRMKPAPRRISPTKLSPGKTVNIGRLTVQVQQGDILQTSCEALVCPTSNQFDLTRGQLSKMLLQTVGQGILHDCQNPLHQSNFYRVISVQNNSISCPFIIFVESPNNARQLTAIISRVLILADKTLRVQTLALPAISTGNAGLQSNVVAQSMVAAFQSFQATNPQYLNRIEVVVYENNKFPVFQSAIDGLSQPHGANASVHLYKQQNAAAQRKRADILKQRRQMKVSQQMSPQPGYSRQQPGGLPHEGRMSGLKQVYQQPQQPGGLPHGGQFSGLPCGIKQQQQVYQQPQRSKNFSSKVFQPIDGSGQIFSADDFNIAARSFPQADSPKRTVKKIAKPVFHLIPSHRPDMSASSVTIDLCSNVNKNIGEAEDRIKREVKEKSLTKTIENDVIAKLSNDEEEEILRLEEKHNIAVWTQSSYTGTELILSGLKDDVYKALECVAEILQDYKAALTCAEYVMWHYTDPETSDMVEFSLRLSSKIESRYKKNENGGTDMHLTIGRTKGRFSLDFRSKTAIAPGMRFEIVRVLKTATGGGDDLPSHWTDMGDAQFSLVRVHSGSTEYDRVLNKFAIFQANPYGGGGNRLISIERIQNPTLYKQFMAQKRKVKTRMQQGGAKQLVTQELFHGTNSEVCSRIYKHGFDRSHCGKNGTAYGRGVYFATAAQYSKSYVKPDANQQHRMFLAEVITGEYCQGNSSMMVLPDLPGTDTQYDSAVNNTQGPTMYVVFKDASVYPSYIATYA